MTRFYATLVILYIISKIYIPIKFKFIFGHCFAFTWLLFSIYISRSWVLSFGKIITIPVAILVITGIAYLPGYIISFMLGSLILDRQPKFTVEQPSIPVTILIAAWNEENNIGDTLRQLAKQDYKGTIFIILIDNNCTDNTIDIAGKTADELRPLNN